MWSKRRFLVRFRKPHVLSSRWSESQTLRAERRVSPKSTTKNKRGQNYKYDLACNALNAALTIHHIGWKNLQTSIYGPGGRLTKSRQHRGQITCGQKYGNMSEAAQWREAKMGYRKTKARHCPKVDKYLFLSLIRQMQSSRKPFKTSEKSWKFRRKQPCPAKTRYACIVEADESTRKRVEGTLLKDHEDHIAGKGISSLSHYNLVHKFIPMP